MTKQTDATTPAHPISQAELRMIRHAYQLHSRYYYQSHRIWMRRIHHHGRQRQRLTQRWEQLGQISSVYFKIAYKLLARAEPTLSGWDLILELRRRAGHPLHNE